MIVPVAAQALLLWVNSPKVGWLVVFGLGAAAFLLEFITEDDEFMKDCLELAKLVAVNILVIDALALWSRQARVDSK